MTIGQHHGGTPLPDGPIEGRVQFQQLVRDALATAAREGWRHIILSDADFADWPLGERAVVDSLNAWSRSGRHIVLLARGWDHVIRHHARFVDWRRTWTHIIDARGCRQADPLELPSAIWSPAWVMQRHDIPRCLGSAGHEAARRHLLRESLDEWLRRSAPAFPATTLGL